MIVYVEDVNDEAPVFTQQQYSRLGLRETTGIGTSVIVVRATDRDTGEAGGRKAGSPFPRVTHPGSGPLSQRAWHPLVGLALPHSVAPKWAGTPGTVLVGSPPDSQSQEERSLGSGPGFRERRGQQLGKSRLVIPGPGSSGLTFG